MMAGVAVIVAAVCTITAMSGAAVSAFSGTVSRKNADNAAINTTKDNTLSANAASDISQPNRAGVAEPFGRPFFNLPVAFDLIEIGRASCRERV